MIANMWDLTEEKLLWWVTRVTSKCVCSKYLLSRQINDLVQCKNQMAKELTNLKCMLCSIRLGRIFVYYVLFSFFFTMWKPPAKNGLKSEMHSIYIEHMLFIEALLNSITLVNLDNVCQRFSALARIISFTTNSWNILMV